jgi:hypothetical protein
MLLLPAELTAVTEKFPDVGYKVPAVRPVTVYDVVAILVYGVAGRPVPVIVYVRPVVPLEPKGFG